MENQGSIVRKESTLLASVSPGDMFKVIYRWIFISGIVLFCFVFHLGGMVCVKGQTTTQRLSIIIFKDVICLFILKEQARAHASLERGRGRERIPNTVHTEQSLMGAPSLNAEIMTGARTGSGMPNCLSRSGAPANSHF